jgi:hypothetical protein
LPLLLFVALFASLTSHPNHDHGAIEAAEERVRVTPSAGSAGDAFVPGRYFVTFSEPRSTSLSQADDRVTRLVGRVAGIVLKRSYRTLPNTVSMELPDSILQLLRADPSIASIVPVPVARAADAELDNAWGVEHIGAGSLHDAGNSGAGVRVAVIDSGILSSHSDLNANYDPSCSYDFVDDDAIPNDATGHGTHVAGTIAAEDNNVAGSVVGVAPDATLCALRVLNSSNSGSFDDIVQAIECASVGCTIGATTVLPADVANLSLSAGADPGSSVANAFAAAYDAGLVIVAAAGNSGTCAGNTESVGWPANYPDVIAAAATDANDVSVCFSSTGAKLVTKGLAAPGVSINSTWNDGGYRAQSGTSMASPHIAGVAALILAADGSLTPDEVWDLLRNTALDRDNPLAPGFPDGCDTWYGCGSLSATAASDIEPDEVHDVAVTGVTAVPSSVAQGSSTNVSVNVANQGNQDETNLTLRLTLDAFGQAAPLIDSAVISLDASATDTVQLTWDTTGVSPGPHTVYAALTVLPAETDATDNTGSTQVTVTGAPEPDPVHDLAVTAIAADPASLTQGDTTAVSVSVQNQGDEDETNVTVRLTDGPGDGPEIASATIDLTAGQADTFEFDWNTIGATLGTHSIFATVISDREETDPDDNVLSTNVEVVAPPLVCPGQTVAEYFANQMLAGAPALNRCEDVPFSYNWGNGSPDASVPVNNFSARWTGIFDLETGTYTFVTRTDDGVRLWLDDELIIDRWVDQGPTEHIAVRTLQAGEHELRMEYYENAGGAVAQLRWESVPDACPGQYTAEYFNNRTLTGLPSLTRCEAAPLTYNWGSASPAEGIPANSFSVRWTGEFTLTPGSYTFIARADDGVRVWLDDELIIDAWKDQGPTEYRATRPIFGGSHEIKMEYYDNCCGAVAQLRWEVGTLQCTEQFVAEYFPNRTLTGTPSLIRCEDAPLTYNWGNASPDPILPANSFSTRWTGSFNLELGSYTFIARADDGVRVWLDGELIIDAWKDQGPTTYSATRAVSGGIHEIKMEYYDNCCGAVAQLRWEFIPSDCPAGQYKAEYFPNRDLTAPATLVRCEAAPVNYSFGSGGPGAPIPNDNFSGRWTGDFVFAGGSTTFTVRTDDGVRLWLDGELIIDAWIDQGPTTRQATRTLTAGTHEVVLEYYEKAGGAVAQLSWQ